MIGYQAVLAVRSICILAAAVVLHSASAGLRCHSLTVYRAHAAHAAHAALLSLSVRTLLMPVTVYRAPALPFVVEEGRVIEKRIHHVYCC